LRPNRGEDGGGIPGTESHRSACTALFSLKGSRRDTELIVQEVQPGEADIKRVVVRAGSNEMDIVGRPA